MDKAVSAAKYFRLFYPGVWEKIAALPVQSFDCDLFKVKHRGKGAYHFAMGFTFHLADATLRIRCREELKNPRATWVTGEPATDQRPELPPPVPLRPADWERIYYSLHYGPPRVARSAVDDDDANCHFRVDYHHPYDEPGRPAHHTHLAAYPSEKIPSEDVEPADADLKRPNYSARDMSPAEFMELVLRFRATGSPPLRKKS